MTNTTAWLIKCLLASIVIFVTFITIFVLFVVFPNNSVQNAFDNAVDNLNADSMYCRTDINDHSCYNTESVCTENAFVCKKQHNIYCTISPRSATVTLINRAGESRVVQGSEKVRYAVLSGQWALATEGPEVRSGIGPGFGAGPPTYASPAEAGTSTEGPEFKPNTVNLGWRSVDPGLVTAVAAEAGTSTEPAAPVPEEPDISPYVEYLRGLLKPLDRPNSKLSGPARPLEMRYLATGLPSVAEEYGPSGDPAMAAMASLGYPRVDETVDETPTVPEEPDISPYATDAERKEADDKANEDAKDYLEEQKTELKSAIAKEKDPEKKKQLQADLRTLEGQISLAKKYVR